MDNFFNDYYEFVKNVNMTHHNPEVVVNERNNLHRINLRQHAFFNHWNVWQDKTVLDVAGYDGRWSFAALKAGAKHTTIIEVRKSVIDKGLKTFKEYNVSDDSYEFIHHDFLSWRPTKKYDVVFCGGFLGHTYDHPTVFSIIRECDPEYLIVDTNVNMLPGNILIPFKNINREGNSHFSENSFVINDGRDIIQNWTVTPSKDYVLELIKTYDFTVIEEFDWFNFIDQDHTNGVEDYWIGKRVSFLCKRNDGWRWDRKSFV